VPSRLREPSAAARTLAGLLSVTPGLHPHHVQLIRLYLDQITPGLGPDPLPACSAQRITQASDLVVQGGPGRGRRRGVPQHIGQVADGDQPVGIEQQSREQRALPAPGDGYHRTFAPDHQRPEQAELDLEYQGDSPPPTTARR
jgi:hypothetical protein